MAIRYLFVLLLAHCRLVHNDATKKKHISRFLSWLLLIGFVTVLPVAKSTPATEAAQITTCLEALVAAQANHFSHTGRYTHHDNLRNTFVSNICQSVILTTFTDFSFEASYFITGRMGNTAFNATLDSGVTAALPVNEVAQRAQTCLRNIMLAQELNFIMYDAYAPTYPQLIDAQGAIDTCEGVAVTSVGVTANHYEYIGRVEACVVRASPTDGVVNANGINAGCPQTIMFDEPEARSINNPPFIINALATSRLPVTFTSATPDVCDVSGAYGERVTLINTGMCIIQADQAGSDTFQPARRVQQAFAVLPAETHSHNNIVISPEPDMQVRNGSTLDAESITSGAIEPLRFGTFKRAQDVTLEFLVRNPGSQVLELGELVLPNFLSVVHEPLPTTLASFESSILSLAVDTRSAGKFVGEISLTSNDPDGFENPFHFDVVVTVSDEPANALYVLPGIDLADVVVAAGRTNVPLLSFYVLVPEGSVSVAVDSLSLAASSDAVRRAQNLRLYIDGGTRGELDPRDVFLSSATDPEALTFHFDPRIFQPDVPMWFVVVGDF